MTCMLLKPAIAADKVPPNLDALQNIYQEARVRVKTNATHVMIDIDADSLGSKVTPIDAIAALFVRITDDIDREQLSWKDLSKTWHIRIHSKQCLAISCQAKLDFLEHLLGIKAAIAQTEAGVLLIHPDQTSGTRWTNGFSNYFVDQYGNGNAIWTILTNLGMVSGTGAGFQYILSNITQYIKTQAAKRLMSVFLATAATVMLATRTVDWGYQWAKGDHEAVGYEMAAFVEGVAYFLLGSIY